MPIPRSTGTWSRSTFIWGLINLLPIWPLDGGQVTADRALAGQPATRAGAGRISSRWSLAGLLAIMIYALHPGLLPHALLRLFAVINYQMLDMIHQAQIMGVYDDDWWRK